MDYRTLISVPDLNRSLNDPALVIFDCRHELMNPEAGARAYVRALSNAIRRRGIMAEAEAATAAAASGPPVRTP